ncbi:MAG: hypothetical protein MHM6MM_001851 [Cercozoa sp. M6MM]
MSGENGLLAALAAEVSAGAGKKKVSGGSFQSMGLHTALLKGIAHMGYRLPTPIQRKSIPVALAGRDIVAMARTGSGKSAAFLIPVLNTLESHRPVGVRALILSPTRELALQTLKFARKLSKHTKPRLRVECVVGGEALETQFEALSGNPDILVATPGRLVHLLHATKGELSLSNVKHVVFDEADQLFELGFAPQLRAILQALPEARTSRQTSLFSATMPEALAAFARAGLAQDAAVIRLDTDTKLSDKLSAAFLHCRSDETLGALLVMLQHVIRVDLELSQAQTQASRLKPANVAPTIPSVLHVPKKKRKERRKNKKNQLLLQQQQQESADAEQEEDELLMAQQQQEEEKEEGEETQTAVLRDGYEQCLLFCATRWRAQLVHNLLRAADISSVVAYGQMDQAARRRALALFRSRRRQCMVVTDVAARGLDLPLLDNVINVDLCAAPKTFVHRAGRVARAGRKGRVLTLVTPEELPYYCDLIRFLQRPILTRLPAAAAHMTDDEKYAKYFVLGTVPAGPLRDACEWLRRVEKRNEEVRAMSEASVKAHEKYQKSRPQATKRGVSSAKLLLDNDGRGHMREKPVDDEDQLYDGIKAHPIFAHLLSQEAEEQLDAATMLERYRPNKGNVFDFLQRKAIAQGKTSQNSRQASAKMASDAMKLELKKRDAILALQGGSDDAGSLTSVAHLAQADEVVRNDNARVHDAEEEEQLKKPRRLSNKKRRKKRQREQQQQQQQHQKQQKKQQEPEQQQVEDDEPTLKKRKKRTDDFRDSRFFVSHAAAPTSEELAERHMRVNGNAVDEENMSNVALLDVDLRGKEAQALGQKRMVQKWDTRKRRYVKQFVMALPTDGGDVATASLSKDATAIKSGGAAQTAFRRWKQRTARSLTDVVSDSDFKHMDHSKRVWHTAGSTEQKQQKRRAEGSRELRDASAIKQMRERKERRQLRNMDKDQRRKVQRKKGKELPRAEFLQKRVQRKVQLQQRAKQERISRKKGRR